MADERLAAGQRFPDLDLEAGREGERRQDRVHVAVELLHPLDAAELAQPGLPQVRDEVADRPGNHDLDGQQRAREVAVGRLDEAADVGGVDVVAPAHDAEAEHSVARRGRAGRLGRLHVQQRRDRAARDRPEEVSLLLLDRPDQVGPVERPGFLRFRGVEVFRREPVRREQVAAAGEAVMGVEDTKNAPGRVLERPRQPRVVHQQRVVAADLEEPVQHLAYRRVPPIVDAVVVAIRRARVRRACHGTVEDLIPLPRHLGHCGARKSRPPFVVRRVVQQRDMRAFALQRPVHLHDAVAVAEGDGPGRHGREDEDAQPRPGALALRCHPVRPARREAPSPRCRRPRPASGNPRPPSVPARGRAASGRRGCG